MRSATSSGCSTSTVEWLMTPGMSELAVRQLDVFPHLPFVLVARVRGLERIGSGPDLQDDVDDVLELHVVDARPHIDAVAGVVADLFGRDVAQRMIERLDATLLPICEYSASVRSGSLIQ